MADRQADVTWTGNLAEGNGTIRLKSGAAGELPVSWRARTEESGGMTSPEELIAAAHASCLSMALSAGLGRGGTPPDQLDVTAVCTIDRADGGYRISKMALTVRGKVPGLDADGFRKAAEAAKEGCPVSQALAGNLEISLNASLI